MMKKAGERLSEILEELRIDQVEIAKLTGKTRGTISNHSRAKKLSLDTAQYICKAIFKISGTMPNAEYIVSGVGEKFTTEAKHSPIYNRLNELQSGKTQESVNKQEDSNSNSENINEKEMGFSEKAVQVVELKNTISSLQRVLESLEKELKEKSVITKSNISPN